MHISCRKKTPARSPKNAQSFGVHVDGRSPDLDATDIDGMNSE
jgi:hypothetical protein